MQQIIKIHLHLEKMEEFVKQIFLLVRSFDFQRV